MSRKIASISGPIKIQPYHRIRFLAGYLDIPDETIDAIETEFINKGGHFKDSAEKVYKLICEKLEKLDYDGDYTYKDAEQFARRYQDMVAAKYNKMYEFYILAKDAERYKKILDDPSI